jgi:hypothetical protein
MHWTRDLNLSVKKLPAPMKVVKQELQVFCQPENLRVQ